jgi:signal transduction histidine kinase
VHRRNNAMLVAVEDNGVGFDVSLVGTEGNGLINMQQRLAEMGGQCWVASEPGTGCRVEFVVPLVSDSQFGWRAHLWPFRRAENREPGQEAIPGEDAPRPT